MRRTIVGLVMLVTSCIPAFSQTITLKLPTIVGNDNPTTTAAFKFKQLVESKSAGRIKVDVFPSGQLAKNENVILEGMQLGTIDVGAVATSGIGGKFDARLMLPDIPFLFQNREQVWKVVDGPVGKDLLQIFDGLGAKGFCFGGGYGFRGVLTNKRPVFTPADLKGQTLRVPPIPTLVELFKALGANPVPMVWGEVYLATMQGTVDGLDLGVTTAVSDKFYEVGKYFSLTNHSYPPIAWLMAKKKYDSLAPDLQKIIDESMTAACQQHREDEVGAEREGLAILRAKGVQINEIRDLDEFQRQAAPVWQSMREKVGKESFDRVVNAARAVVN